MKQINTYITEKLKLNKTVIYNTSNYSPETKEDLIKLIKEEINQYGNECNLNHIDTSKITDMSDLFSRKNNLENWDGDISEWNVSNVTNMIRMFAWSNYTGRNGSINNWDVSNVEDMSVMFVKSCFNSDISSWKLNPNCKTQWIFYDCVIKEEYKPKLPPRK